MFAALRDDSDEAAEARQQPVLAYVILAGVAGVLSSALTGRVLDDPAFGNSVYAVLSWAFLGGLFYGFIGFWLGGLMVFALARGIGSSSSYRQARHLVGLAAAPLALTLVFVWPLRIAIYGNDLFRSGGSDSGAGNAVFNGLLAAAYLWMFGLAALGLFELRKRSSSSSDIS